MKNEQMTCPVCHKPLQVYARGKDIRFYSCPSCANDLELKLFMQPTTKLRALRTISMGALIELPSKNDKPPEIG